MIAYIAGSIKDKKVLITAKIPDAACIKNIGNIEIVNKETCSQLVDIIIPIKIEDIDGKEYDSAELLQFDKDVYFYSLTKCVLNTPASLKWVRNTSGSPYEPSLPPFIIFSENKNIMLANFYNKKTRTDGEIIEYQSNGRIYQKYNIINGKLNGKCEKWYDNGQKEKEYEAKDDYYCGKFTEWYENGSQKCERYYNNQKLNGICTYYKENGKINYQCVYKDDVLQKLESLKLWISPWKKNDYQDTNQETNKEEREPMNISTQIRQRNSAFLTD